MDALTLILAALAIYRVAHMVTLETGPFGLCERWRGWVFMHAGKDSWITEGVNCPLCVSFWLSLIAALLLAPVEAWVLVWLGLAGAALVLHKAVT